MYNTCVHVHVYTCIDSQVKGDMHMQGVCTHVCVYNNCLLQLGHCSNVYTHTHTANHTPNAIKNVITYHAFHKRLKYVVEKYVMIMPLGSSVYNHKVHKRI